MAFGLTIYNQGGTEMISENFSSYYIVSSGIYANGQQPNWYGDGTINGQVINNAGGAIMGDIMYVRPHVLDAALYNDTVGPNGQNQVVSTSGYVEWVLTRKLASQVGPTNFGLRIYRTDGSTSFDAQIKTIQPSMHVRDTANESGPGNWTTVYGPGAPLFGRKRYIARVNLERILGITSGNANSSYIHWYGSDQNALGLYTRAYPGWSSIPDKWTPGWINYMFADIKV